jgi:hypothetical protein
MKLPTLLKETIEPDESIYLTLAYRMLNGQPYSFVFLHTVACFAFNREMRKHRCMVISMAWFTLIPKSSGTQALRCR